MTLKTLSLITSLGAAMLAGSAARAATTTITDTQEGWLTATDSSVKHGIFNPLIGFCGADDCTLPGRATEYRDFFTFAIPTLGQNVASADLFVDLGLIILDQSSSITLQFTSTSSQTFAALGGGTVFATETFTEADGRAPTDPPKFIDIHLDAAAIAAINASGGKTFEISGRMTSPFTTSPSADQLALASVTPAKLVLTPVPEPATWGLLILGFSSLGAVLRRRRKVVAARA